LKAISGELLAQFTSLDKDIKDTGLFDAAELGKNVDKLTSEISRKINDVIADINKNAGQIAETLSKSTSQITKTMDIKESADMQKFMMDIDKLNKGLAGITKDTSGISEKLSTMFGGDIHGESNSGEYIRAFTRIIDCPDLVALEFENPIGDIHINVQEGNHIDIHAHIKAPFYADDIITILDSPGVYCVKTKYLPGSRVSLEVEIPKALFQRISISTFNGRLRLIDTKCKDLLFAVQDGKINISGAECISISGNTSRTKVEISDTDTEILLLKAVNSHVKLDNNNIKNCSIENSKERIMVDLPDSTGGKSDLMLVNSGARIDIFVPSSLDAPLYIDASNDGGQVLLGLNDFCYVINEKVRNGIVHLEGFTPGYETAENRIRISAHTSGASITIRQQ
jgi:hypothetical protein